MANNYIVDLDQQVAFQRCPSQIPYRYFGYVEVEKNWIVLTEFEISWFKKEFNCISVCKLAKNNYIFSI